MANERQSTTFGSDEASKRFYEKLGVAVFAGDQSRNWLIMKNDDHAIGLFQGMFDRNVHGRRELQRQLKNRGVRMVSEVDESSTGPASFMIVDPDGNTILVDQHA